MARGLSTVGPASQQVAKLRSQGFVAFEIDSAVGRIVKVGRGKAPRTRAQQRRLMRMATIGATTLAHIKRRAMRGDLATHPRPYSTGRERNDGRPGYVVAQAYSERTAAGRENYGATSADWHRKAGSVPGNTTGLMWQGAQAVASGRTGARLEFAGSSIGTSSAARIRRRETRKGVKTSARLGKKARNRWKATAVFNNLNVNVLQPRESENQAIGDMLLGFVMDGARVTLDLRRLRSLGTTGDRRLYTALARQQRRQARG